MFLQVVNWSCITLFTWYIPWNKLPNDLSPTFATLSVPRSKNYYKTRKSSRKYDSEVRTCHISNMAYFMVQRRFLLEIFTGNRRDWLIQGVPLMWRHQGLYSSYIQSDSKLGKEEALYCFYCDLVDSPE